MTQAPRLELKATFIMIHTGFKKMEGGGRRGRKKMDELVGFALVFYSYLILSRTTENLLGLGFLFSPFTCNEIGLSEASTPVSYLCSRRGRQYLR